MNRWNLFVSHASEDKETFVRGLAEALTARGLHVWYDEFTLKLGDSLRRSIDDGLASCDFGVVVLSHAFFNKNWAQKELDGLVQRETVDRKIILPVWHDIDQADVVKASPTLADRVAVKTSDGLERVVQRIIEVVRPEMVVEAPEPSGTTTSTGAAIAPPGALTKDNLLRYANENFSGTAWSGHILKVYTAARALRINSIEQFHEAVSDAASFADLSASYRRLLNRDPDPVGKLIYQPWIFLEGASGKELVEQSILGSSEYQSSRPPTGNLNVPEGYEKSIAFHRHQITKEKKTNQGE